MSLLVPDAVGAFVPALAKELKDRLAAIDPRLGLAIVPNALGDGQTRWGVTFWWRADDPRRASGGDPARCFDVLCYLPADCPIDEAAGFITTRFRQLHGRDDVRKLLERIHLLNRQRQREIVQPTLDLANELVETNARTLFRNEKGTIGSTLDTMPRTARDQRDWDDYRRDVGSDAGA